MLFSGSGGQLCSPPAVLFWRWLFTVLVYWRLLSLPCSLFLGPSPCCQHVVMVFCLFFNFVEPFDFGCCSLAQEISFVVMFLPYFRQWLITSCCFSSCLLRVPIEISSLPLPPSLVCFQHSSPLDVC
jgi:hypothetical protein